MKGLCGTCLARPTCNKLCPLALTFVKKHISMRELLFADIDIANKPHIEWPLLTRSNKQLILDLYFIDRRRQTDIADHLGVSRSYVSKVVKQIREKARWLIG